MKKLYLLILMILILVACQNSNPDPIDPLLSPKMLLVERCQAMHRWLHPKNLRH